MSAELIAEARKVAEMYRGVGHKHGIEDLLERLADEMQNSDITLAYDGQHIANLEAILEAAKRPGWLGRNIDRNASTVVDTARIPPEEEW